MVAVQAADILSTHVAFQSLPGIQELNPLAQSLISHVGFSGLGIIKMGVAATGISLLELVRRKQTRGEVTPTTNLALRISNSIYGIVLINNASNLLLK